MLLWLFTCLTLVCKLNNLCGNSQKNIVNIMVNNYVEDCKVMCLYHIRPTVLWEKERKLPDQQVEVFFRANYRGKQQQPVCLHYVD